MSKTLNSFFFLEKGQANTIRESSFNQTVSFVHVDLSQQPKSKLFLQ